MYCILAWSFFWYYKISWCIYANKGTALQALCNTINIPISKSIAVGDEENDQHLPKNINDMPVMPRFIKKSIYTFP